MARNERVTYECDVCGRKVDAQKIAQEGNIYYVRPDGWGHIYTSAQRRGTKVQRKSDFCSEDCLTQAFEEWAAEAYG